MIDNISRESFEKLKSSDKLNIIYDCMCMSHDRLKELEKKKFWDTATSAIGGVIGGIIAVILKYTIWK